MTDIGHKSVTFEAKCTLPSKRILLKQKTLANCLGILLKLAIHLLRRVVPSESASE